MKNLKKVLSLVLALAMAMSLMTAAFAADTDFADKDKIEKTEAVEVMAEIGILQGNNGNFDPQGNLTRETAAKLIAYMLLGTTDAEKQAAKTAFDDVAVTRWSASYVAYCASENIITGNGAGKFYPTTEVTGYQFGKMILVALGYDPVEKGLVGEGWEINVGKYLVAEGLDENLDDVDMNKALTRENAAQMILNAMKWTGTEKVYAVDYTENNGTKRDTFEDRTDALLFSMSKSGSTYVGPVDKTEGSLLDEVYGVDVLTNSTDDFGRPATIYVMNDKDDTELTYADKADATFTGVTAEKAVYAALTAVKATNNEKTVASIYEDGYAVRGTIDYNKTSTDNAAYFGNGVTVELFKMTTADGTDYYRLVAVRDYLATVTDVNDAKPKEEIKRSIDLTMDNDAHGYGKDIAEYETENFDEDDVVVINVSVKSNEVVVKSIKLAEKVENVAVTSYKEGGMDKATFVANGKTYMFSQTTTNTTTTALDVKGDTTYTLYLDTMGNVLKTEVYSASASTNYVYVAQTQVKVVDSNLYDADAKSVKADVIFTDGTHKVVDLKVTKKTTSGTTTYTYTKPNNNGTITANTALSNEDDAVNVGNWFAYTVASDGSYKLEAVTDTYANVIDKTASGAKLTISKDSKTAVSVTIGGTSTTLYTNKDTKVVAIDEDYNLSSFVGYPAADKELTGNILVTYTKDSKVVSAIYVVDQAITADNKEYAYAISKGSKVADGIEWLFAIDGKQVTYVMDESASVEAKKVYTLKETDTTGVYDVDGTAITLAGTDITLLESDFVVAGSAYDFASDCVIYNVDEDLNDDEIGKVDTLTKGDKIHVITNGDGDASVIYIVEEK